MVINATLRYCNWLEYDKPMDVETHTHKHWELVLYSNTGVSVVDGVAYDFVPGSFVIIPSDTPHSEHSEPGRIICIGYDTDMPKTMFQNVLYMDHDGTVGSIAEMIVNEIQTEPPYYTYRIYLLLRDLLLQIMRKNTERKRKPDDKLKMIQNYLDAYCTTNVDFDALATSLNYSYDYLRHYFKMQTNISLKQYVIQRRILLAKEYLISDVPVVQVAANCGFKSAAHFTATFRQITGLTPRQFRENSSNIITEGNDPIFQE